MLVSYLILPDKRRHPSLLILNVSASIFLFSMVVFFSIGNPLKLQCANDVTVSTQDNNALCATQGILAPLYFTLNLCCAPLFTQHTFAQFYRSDFNFLIFGNVLLECCSYCKSALAYRLEL